MYFCYKKILQMLMLLLGFFDGVFGETKILQIECVSVDLTTIIDDSKLLK